MYRNPVLAGDNPDPSVLRDGNVFDKVFGDFRLLLRPADLEIRQIDPGHGFGKDGKPYLFTAEGGATAPMLVVARSRSINGPRGELPAQPDLADAKPKWAVVVPRLCHAKKSLSAQFD